MQLTKFEKAQLRVLFSHANALGRIEERDGPKDGDSPEVVRRVTKVFNNKRRALQDKIEFVTGVVVAL